MKSNPIKAYSSARKGSYGNAKIYNGVAKKLLRVDTKGEDPSSRGSTKCVPRKTSDMRVRFDLSQNEIASTNVSDAEQKNYFSQKMSSDQSIRSSSMTPKKSCLKVSSNTSSGKDKRQPKGTHFT